MTPPLWPQPQEEVAYFRDRHGTWFAAAIARAPRWSASLLAPPDDVVADVCIAFLDNARVPSSVSVPSWLAVLPAREEMEPASVVHAANVAWEASPSYRGRGAPAEEYVVAGFQALCPPHPPCDPSPTARESLTRFLRERPGILGGIAELGRDGFNRALRLYWPCPEDFADSILHERIRDEGAGGLLDLAAYLRDARLAEEVREFSDLAFQREALVARLQPLRFFTDASDFDRAVEEARAWRERYDRAYDAHYREVLESAHAVLVEVGPALEAASELDALNRNGRAVGDDAVHRLAGAVTALRALPDEVEGGLPVTGEVYLGRMPEALTEARSAAAAVMAALEVQRTRATDSSSAAASDVLWG